MSRHVLATMLGLVVLSSSAPNVPECRSELCRLIAAASLPHLHWPDFQDRQLDIAGFYEPSGYALAWVQEGKATPEARAIIDALKNADAKGLDPEDYEGSRWDAHLARLDSGEAEENGAIRFDLALTVSVMRYASDLCIGRANPQKPRFSIAVNNEQYDLPGWVRRRLVNSRDPGETFAEVEPPFDGYRRTEQALQQYLRLAQEDEAAQLPSSKKPIDPGQSYPGVARLASWLRRLGDLPAPLLPPEVPVYQGALVTAVRHFQLRHGLEPDGRIGTQTLQQLNTPLSFRVRQLQLTLERWRWIPRAFSRPPIVVNIPEFRLRAFDDSYRTELEMEVVVGKAYRHQTPVFASELKSVIFRPYWNVPMSIQRAELVPQLERDPSYLVKEDYEVVTRQGEVVTNEIVSEEILAQLRAGKLSIRQVPGPKNALGGVKFIFPNDNDVYLHDTPARQLFSRSRRDFSHGCIRVERALDLALWVLEDNPRWSREKIVEAMNGETPVQVNLARPIPVLIVYGTAVVPADGMPYFFEDIYGLDALLERQLAQSTNAGPGPRPRE